MALALLLLGALGLPAQPSSPASEEVRGPGIVIRHPPGRRQRAIDFLGAFLEQRPRVLLVTGVLDLPEVRLELFEDVVAMNRRLREVTSYTVPEWTAGAAVGRLDWIVIRLDAPGPESVRLHGLLAHELAHLAIATADRQAGRRVVPRWLDEGIAQVVEGRTFSAEAADLAPRAFFGTLIPLDELERAFPESEGASALAYTQAHEFVRFLDREYPATDLIPTLLDRLAERVPLEVAVRDLFGVGLPEMEARWVASLEGDRSWILRVSGQVLFAFLILFAVVLGASRLVRRRRSLERRWEEEDEVEGAAPPLGIRRFRPPLRRLGRDEPPPEP